MDATRRIQPANPTQTPAGVPVSGIRRDPSRRASALDDARLAEEQLKVFVCYFKRRTLLFIQQR